jgi:putative endonuclease
LENSSEKFTAKANDWKLKGVFEVSTNETEAIRMERFIKKQKSRKLIEQLCELNFVPTGFLAHLVRLPHLRD